MRTAELRAFLAHVARGHESEPGRWGDRKVRQNREPVRPSTMHSYYRRLRTLFGWLAEEETCPLAASPMRSIRAPVMRPDHSVSGGKGRQLATLSVVTPSRFRSFLVNLRGEPATGRFGCDHAVAQREARPSTAATHYRALRVFRQLQTPVVNVGVTGQVNVGGQQVNVESVADREVA